MGTDGSFAYPSRVRRAGVACEWNAGLGTWGVFLALHSEAK